MKLRLLITCLFFLTAASVFAQESTLKGKILDETGAPLIGVTVVLKSPGGSTVSGVGAVTDANGEYSLKLPENQSFPLTLTYKFVGYSDQDVEVKSASSAVAEVKMSKADVGLDVLVVSASRRAEKLIDAPASVTVLNLQKLETNTPLTVTDNLKKVPGIYIMETGLVAHNVVARGFNNIFSGALMTLVDNRIAAVPSLRVNAFQLIPTSNSDVNKIEVVRGPGSALYGPNASDGVLYIETKSPLAQKNRFEVMAGVTGGGGVPQTETWIVQPELRISGKVKDFFGYKISGSLSEGKDWRYYDEREPAIGDSLIYGTASGGKVFIADTSAEEQPNKPRKFDRNFDIKKYNIDGRLDFKLPKEISVIVNGGFAQGTNIELTGLGAAQAIKWKSYYTQIRFKWKNLFAQYYMNGSNSGDTYLIPQVGVGAKGPHKVQPLTDKSIFHVVQLQHSVRPWTRLNLIYGLDFWMTRPNTEGTINGRFEDEDNTNQIGGYLQGDLDLLKKLKLVAAFRLDYMDRIKEVMFSPRAALVYKVNNNHTLRATYNRAFYSPSSLNLFLDLSNGLIPNGINVRGLGNPNGMDYRYASDGSVQMISPYTGTWSNPYSKELNAIAFDSMLGIISSGLQQQSGYPAATVNSLVSTIFGGIAGDTGTINNVDRSVIDYLSKEEWTNGFSKVDKIGSTVTQTYELGYKGSVIKNKLFITADAYYTRINNYVSPLTLASAAVVFDNNSLVSAMGPADPSGLLFQNLQKASPFGGTIDFLLSGIKTPDGKYLFDGVYTSGGPNGTVYDDVIGLILGANNAIPIGSITPDNDKVGYDQILVYRNLGRVEVFGFDLGANYNVWKGIDLSFAGSWVSKDRITLKGAQDGYVALNSPKWKTTIGIDHKFEKLGFGYGLTWRWQDAFPANSAVYVGDVPAMNMVDLRLSYRPNTDSERLNGLLLSVSVNNLLDYRFSPFPGTAQMGRTIIGKINYTFGVK